MILKFKKCKYDLSVRTYIMGILNITPDSFSDGGTYFDSKPKFDLILKTAMQMEKDGADFIDVGGESSRPGSDPVSEDEELQRVIPVIEILSSNLNIPISVDTYKSCVAKESLRAGAEIVNDISGFRFDNAMPSVVKEYNAKCILMHIKGTPRYMQLNPEYLDVLEEVKAFLLLSTKIALSHDINEIILDPGIGFGKTLEHNLRLINNLSSIADLGFPLMVGLSNKSFMDKIFPSKPYERLEGTLAANTAAIFKGANILRVHNVLSNKRAARIADEIMRNND